MMIETRAAVREARRYIVKIGSALLTNDGRGLDHSAIQRWVEQIVELRGLGIEVILVSSGAVAEGMKRLGWKKRPMAVHELQAAAAVGQMGLIQAYESCFQRHQIHTAQVLLTHEDLTNRERYLNARSTLRTLLALKVIPVINENDTVATEEIRLGDNDTLGALVAVLVEADLLVILTDQEGMFEADPRQCPTAPLVRLARADDPQLLTMASADGGSLGRGGMHTKIKAAARAGCAGAATIIAWGRRERVLPRLAAGEEIGTLLLPATETATARKQWLASHLRVKGRLFLDAGAVQALRESGKSLLAVGVVAVEGEFQRGEMVSCFNSSGREVARGLVNYSATEIRRIAGMPSRRIVELLGYVDEAELIHRDNLVLVTQVATYP
ncbi:Glutamate 5-kinase [Gammaproteobacteria bacterium]